VHNSNVPTDYGALSLIEGEKGTRNLNIKSMFNVSASKGTGDLSAALNVRVQNAMKGKFGL